MKEPSEAPYDLNFQCTDNEYLIVNWKHPNKTNGDIEYFIITLSVNKDSEKPIKKHFFKSISKYMWQYTHKIEEQGCLNLTQLEIGITAFNGYVGKEISVNFSSQYYQKKNKAQPVDHSNKFEQESLHNNSTETANNEYGSYFDDLNKQSLLDNSSNFFGNLEEKREEGEKTSDKIFDKQNFSPLPNYYEKEQPDIGSSSFPNPANKILKKGNSSITLFLSSFLLAIIVITIFVVIWIKKSSWNSENGCKGMLCLRVNNDVPQHEEAPLTTRGFENSKVDDTYLYTPQAIKTEGNTNNKNYPINLEHEHEESFSRPIELEKFKELSAQQNDIENEFKMFIEKTPKTDYETVNQQLFEYIDLVFDDGTRIPQAYIATKIPIAEGIQNFWKHIFEDNIQFVVLLGEVGSIEKHFTHQQYWPEENEKMVYPDISVQQIYDKSYSYYTIRKFVLIVDETIKQVEQIHCSYIGSNPRKLAPFIKKFVQLQSRTNSSALVHSSTGIGGVGTVLLCSLSLRLAQHNKKTIDVLHSMCMLRKYISGFIRNPEQYKLIYLIISHVLFKCEDDDSNVNDYINF